jgi:protoporphyrin/coproporphyrin ferrochelatase
MEVLYDLDTEALHLCEELGMNMVRAAAVGTNPGFARMVRELIVERMDGNPARPSVGNLGPCPDVCPADCCPQRTQAAPASR